MFKKAERKAAHLKMGITGPSGSGKTTGALKLARGLVGPEGRIAVIDTENESASLYEDVTDFYTCDLSPPFEHGKFSESIRDAESSGYDAVIIDSASHFWEGILSYKDKLDSRGGNSYTNWAEAGRVFKGILDSILQSKIHVVLCLRSKIEHAIEKDDRGRTQIRKVGMAPIMRDGIEYEFTVVFDLDMNHQASSSKDRTRLFDGKFLELNEATGQQLRSWLDGGKGTLQGTKEAPSNVTIISGAPPMVQKDLLEEIWRKWKLLEKHSNDIIPAIKWTHSDAFNFSGMEAGHAKKLSEELSRQLLAKGKSVAARHDKFEDEDDLQFEEVNFASELKWLEKEEEIVNPKLVEMKWIKESQTFRDLTDANVSMIINSTESFCKRMGIEVPEPKELIT